MVAQSVIKAKLGGLEGVRASRSIETVCGRVGRVEGSQGKESNVAEWVIQALLQAQSVSTGEG